SLIIILIQNSLDAGGFTRSRVTEKQAVVRLSSLHKSFCVINQFFLRNLISHQIIQIDMSDFRDRLNHHFSLFIMADPESLVQSQFSHTEFPVKLHHVIHEFIRILRLAKFPAQFTDPVTNSLVEQFAVLIDILIVNHKVTPQIAESLIKICEIKIIEFFENFKIMARNLIDGSFHSSHNFTGSTESILVVDQQKSQIVMPQVSGKSVSACQLHQLIHTLKKF